MASTRIGNSIAVAAFLATLASAQDQAETCYGSGSVIGAVVGTLIITTGVLVSGFFLYKMYWKNRKGKHLVLMTDAENPHDQYAFDNPCFREATPIKRDLQDEKRSSNLEKPKWPGWPPIHTFGKDQKSEKITSMDDSYVNDSRLKIVTLKSHDFTGLGFNICGNMRDGIFVKDVLHRGPAFESGCINTGDRIDSVCISFRNMVFEDALTILSYASPYDVQIQVENDSYSRPSTLMRSKRESYAVNSSERILHPKFNRSQSISYLNEIGKNSNKKPTLQIGFMLEKNRINHSLNKSQDFTDYLAIKTSSLINDGKTNKNVTPKIDSPLIDSHDRECESRQMKSLDAQNKLQKFGIKVLPININPKMGIQSMTGIKKPTKSPTRIENELNSAREKTEKPEKPEKSAKSKELFLSTPLEEDKISRIDEPDTNRENIKAMLAKGFFTLKDKINQNTSGKKKREENENLEEEEGKNERLEADIQEQERDFPIPKLRSSITCKLKASEQNEQNQLNVPEEVFRAGDVARSNRKSLVETTKPVINLESENNIQMNKTAEVTSDGEDYSDKESVKDEAKRAKKSKGKAPAPPKQTVTSKEINEIKKESEFIKDETNIFEPEAKTIPLKDEERTERNLQPSYDSDSESEPITVSNDISNTKIELNATQVTIHQHPAGDTNDDDMEPNRKAASLGDLSKLDSEQPLSIVLERAVSLDLTEGTSQCGKKRKAPLPPSEEFPAVFDDLNYRKEPRLEGLNTFQRRLKKSSDFGTLEDALCDGPKSLELAVNKQSPIDLKETHSYNIQEFSSWLAECRRPKTAQEEIKNDESKRIISSTSLININSYDCAEGEKETKDKYEYAGSNVSFSVNGKNFPGFEVSKSSENSDFSRPNSRMVLVISQPNSLEPAMLEKSDAPKEAANGKNEFYESPETSENEVTPPKLPSSPMPTSNTLSSTLTYITEIKVSTSEEYSGKSEFGIPSFNSIGQRIQKFDSPKSEKSNSFESSKIPIRTMKSETGQKILATIQSLTKESLPTKTPEAEYAKRMASIFSNSQKNEDNTRKNEAVENEINRPNISGLYLKTSPPKPSKDYSPTRKVPPVVPPRKTETSLTNKSTVMVELQTPLSGSNETNKVPLLSLHNEELGSPSRITSKIKEHEDINGKDENVVPVKTSATKIVFESKENKEGF